MKWPMSQFRTGVIKAQRYVTEIIQSALRSNRLVLSQDVIPDRYSFKTEST